MKQIRSVTIFLILASFVFADHGRAKHKRWKHKKRHKINVVHKQPRLKISLGYNYFWRKWNFGYHHWNKHQSNNIVVVNKDVTRNIETKDFDEIISNIEKLAILREKGIISEYEYKKKKRDLLKNI
tara:strand:+ start:1382 stop:1759 length:378 start_codon:yes stop_codon:yes gene_type:complete